MDFSFLYDPEYIEGGKYKDVVLVFVHGFLDTKESHVMRETAESLNSLGYSILLFNQQVTKGSKIEISKTLKGLTGIKEAIESSDKIPVFIGHSLGALLLLVGLDRGARKILLDPAIPPKDFDSSIIDTYFSLEEVQNQPDIHGLIPEQNMFVFFAETGSFSHYEKDMLENKIPHTVVKNSNHNFTGIDVACLIKEKL